MHLVEDQIKDLKGQKLQVALLLKKILTGSLFTFTDDHIS